ncbi:MAG: tetratricopeptide repeat protein [Thermotogota bacterium]
MDYRDELASTNRLKQANEILKRGKVKDALSLYADIIEEDPENPLVYYNMGVAFVEREDYDLARQVFTHCLKLGLQDSRIYIGLGICSLHFSENDKALEFFGQIDSTETSYKEALIGKVYAYLNNSEPQKAMDILNELKQLNIWNQELSLIERKAKWVIYSLKDKN